MKIYKTNLKDALVFTPAIHSDARGYFSEAFNKHDFCGGTNINFNVVQVNQSHSKRHVLRGLHYQIQHTQAKLIWVTHGTIYDVIVDLRRSSPSFGKWAGFDLSANNKKQVYVPEGFAHGFIVLSKTAYITYLTSATYSPEFERCLRWNCPQLDIKWPVNSPHLTDRDANAPDFGSCETYP